MAAFYVLAKYLHLTPGLRRLQLAPGGGAKGAQLAGIGGASVRDAADRPADDAVFSG